jgi:transcriptional regulator
MARANEQWKHFRPEAEVLCIFHGPHAYISPSWYVDQHTVPTWNYAAVHVYGRPGIVNERDALRQIVFDTTEKYESQMPQPWKLPLSEAEVDAMLKAIVGFEIAITRVQGKFKLGQNRIREDREGLVRGLRSSGHPASIELADFTVAHT